MNRRALLAALMRGAAGLALARAAAPPAAAIAICPSCGSPNPGTAPNCVVCGGALRIFVETPRAPEFGERRRS